MNEPEDLGQVTETVDSQDQNQAGGAFTDAGERHHEPGARSTNLENGSSFSIAVDAQASTFVAIKDGVEFGAVPFAEKNGRVTLLATSILPDYRGQGLATELTRRVLDSIRAEGKSATVRCPVFRSFIERNPEYAAMVTFRALDGTVGAMSEPGTENPKPVLGSLRFENTRFDPDLTPFHELAKDMATQFGYAAELSGDRVLLQLLRLRVAQLNPCSYCLILHAEVAARIGIRPEQAAHLASWRESTMYSPRQRAALAYCEGLTSFRHEEIPALHEELRLHFTEREVAEIAAVVINMNVWTRLKLAQGATPSLASKESP